MCRACPRPYRSKGAMLAFPYLRPQPSQTYDMTDFISSGSLKSSPQAQATFPRSQGRDVAQPGLFFSMPKRLKAGQVPASAAGVRGRAPGDGLPAFQMLLPPQARPTEGWFGEGLGSALPTQPSPGGTDTRLEAKRRRARCGEGPR